MGKVKSKRVLELEAELERARFRESYLAWTLRAHGELPRETYIVIPRPRYGVLIAFTDDHGVPVYAFDAGDSPRVREEFAHLYRLGATDQSERLSDRLNEALKLARKKEQAKECGTTGEAF